MRLFIVCLLLSSCGAGLNHPNKPNTVRVLAPDRVGISFKFDEEDDFRGYNFIIGWNLD